MFSEKNNLSGIKTFFQTINLLLQINGLESLSTQRTAKLVQLKERAKKEILYVKISP